MSMVIAGTQTQSARSWWGAEKDAHCVCFDGHGHRSVPLFLEETFL